jgi:CheY-like chemotaxis protein
VKGKTKRSHNFSNVIEQKQTQPKKILIVEINEFLRCLYKMELEDEGYITLEASNARKAIKK